jgi:hypothetical protein
MHRVRRAPTSEHTRLYTFLVFHLACFEKDLLVPHISQSATNRKPNAILCHGKQQPTMGTPQLHT